MDAKMDAKELISALADGQLHGEELARALDAACADREALRTWQAYHLIGDVLRSGELGMKAPASAFLERLTLRLEQEAALPQAAVVPVITVRPGGRAANDANFRWKLVAGVASVAAFTAIGWSVVGSGGPSPSVQPQLAAAPAAPAVAAAPASQETVLARSGAGLMIRDPKLDELLAAHRQLGGASALQMPAGFLRSATSEAPGR